MKNLTNTEPSVFVRFLLYVCFANPIYLPCGKFDIICYANCDMISIPKNSLQSDISKIPKEFISLRSVRKGTPQKAQSFFLGKISTPFITAHILVVKGEILTSKIKKKRDLLCNYSEVVEKTDVKITPFYGLSFCLYCYSSAAAAVTQEPTTTAAATNP